MEDTELQTVETEISDEEEQHLLSNSCEYNEAHLAEAVRQRMKLKRLQNYILAFSVALLFVYSLISWYRMHKYRYLVFGGMAIAIGVLFVYMITVLPRKAARNETAKMRSDFGGTIVRILFREEDIRFINPNGEEASVLYSTIAKIVVSRNLILLFQSNGHMILLDPNQFVNGEEIDFWKKMKQKAPKALPKHS